MPLKTPYGVVSGTVLSADLQNPDTGKWPHYHVHVATPAGPYDSAINLKSMDKVQVEYRVLDPADRSRFASVLALPDGWTALAQNPGSGALDYVRHPGLNSGLAWHLQSGNNLIVAMQGLLLGVQRIHIFGAAYQAPDHGVHEVHMNQGDPLDSDFSELDGIWQDGGILFEYGGANPHVSVLQIKFETQSMHTDENGRPSLIRWHPPVSYIPRRHWPPDDPLSDPDRVTLIEHGLYALASRAAEAIIATEAERSVILDEVRASVSAVLGDASEAHVAEITDYLQRLGVAAALHR